MAIFKCKMCGGVLDIKEGQSVIVCDYCSTAQTLPRLDTERRAQLYDRANHHLRNNEYDKAMGMYESILNEDNTDAEAYWSIVLCRFGISYVKDPNTGKYFLTVNRMLKTSIKTDADFKEALNYANEEQKAIYAEEAAKILAIQQKFDKIYKEEEPFDVFISYKETDENGKRTHDSVLAYDLYHQLTQEGFKVFFSRVTLEHILGTEYEPYIFAALNSAKVMVVLGTDPKHFNAVWVKNEWSRYLALIHNGEQKVLIPAYKDMDPYDMPDEFQHLQAQDMSKLGFMQDLIRGINKILGKDKQQASQAAVTANVSGTSAVQLLKRATLFLEDSDWGKADEYCERVLDIDPENARAYLAKLCVKLQVESFDKLATYPESIKSQDLFQKAFRYADEDFKKELAGYELAIQKEIQRKEDEFRAEQERRRIELETSQKEKHLKEQETKSSYLNLAHKYEGEGNMLQAAKNYFRSGNIEGVRRTYNFSKKIAVADIVAALNPNGKIIAHKSPEKILGDAIDYEACTEIAMSKTHFVALRKDGTVVASGDNDEQQCMVSSWKNIAGISAATDITVGLTKNGTIVSTDPAYNGLGWSDVTDVVAQENYIIALNKNGTVYVSDKNLRSTVADWKDIVYIAAYKNNVAGITAGGRIVTNTPVDESYYKIEDAMVVAWKENDLYAVDCRGNVHCNAKKEIPEENDAQKVCEMCGYIGESDFEVCPLCGAKKEKHDPSKLIGADALNGIYALTFFGSTKYAALSEDLSVTNSVTDKFAADEKTGTVNPEPMITNELKDICESLLKTVISGFERSYEEFSELKYDKKETFEKEKGKIAVRSPLFSKFEAVCRNNGSCKPYLYRRLIESGYTGVKIKTEYSSEAVSTNKDYDQYNLDLSGYYNKSDLLKGYKPELKKSAEETKCSICITCNSGTSQSLDKAEKTIAKSSKSSSSSFDKTVLIKPAIIIAIIVALGAFIIGTGNYPGGDGFVGKIFQTLSNNVSDIKQTFGIGDKKDKSETQDYYVISSDYDSINIRTGAGSDNSILTTVSDREQKLIPTGEVSGKWIQITINGETGWVHNSVVEFVDQ